MQSQLEAALLGHSTNLNHDDDENNYPEEETEDNEEFDEDVDGDHGKGHNKQLHGKESNNRTVTLQMLLSAGILEPGPGTMTIEYLGQRFVGDLLGDGKIKSQETDVVFASPSAWAIACKRFINPDKKSGCGWASVKYKGRKLDAYKNVWYKKKKEEEKLEKESINLEQLLQKNMSNSLMYQRIVVKHNTIANRTLTHDANTMIDCVPFSNLGKIQPFLVSLSTNAALLMDFHCHLTKSEVSGYLAGYWDVNAHNLQITHAFPCRCTKTDRENAQQVELEISKAIDREKLTLVGWYHSHPFAAAAPTLRDVDAQLDYQIKMKGTSDNNYTPCVGIIISPYNYENASLESSIIAYWVIPPPETKPNEYGRPMLMSYSVIQDSILTPNIKDEMMKCVEYYRKENDFVNFNERYLGTTCYIDKLKSTLISKFPRDESETTLWRFIREQLGISSDEKETLLSIPNVSKSSQLLPNLNTPVSLSSNLMLPTDISSILFNSGKFPSASSLLGLPDPMAHSTLAANNMFLQTNLFKMQELLKPLSTSSPITGKSKTDHKPHSSSSSTPLKIPTDIKPSKPSDYSMDILGLKSKMDFTMPDLNLSKIGKEYSMTDYISNLSKLSSGKQDFSVPDLSIGKSSLSDYLYGVGKQGDLGDRMAKMPKMDYSGSMLDLSVSKGSAASENVSDTPTDLSIGMGDGGTFMGGQEAGEDKPLNLAGE
ncbi:MPN domain-containing protein CG4751-like isoform X2 [Anoplophora glabripennis]|uniref:MPN domain-containing protein CG4751-like isoform X2 n=1 Tax=Anoplophora glabripennis TaxID=217634 RepID=UPI00087461D1|nr:MPN domain-containing protein CG4751-like isoform X2 [Anoplophora glabripennis]